MLALSDQKPDDGIVIHDEDFLQTFKISRSKVQQ